VLGTMIEQLTTMVATLQINDEQLDLIVRINCIGLVGLHHLFYKGAAGPLGLQGCATPGAASPVAATPSSASSGAGPLGLQGRQPIRVSGGAPPLVPRL
jgi:hypothetical protein